MAASAPWIHFHDADDLISGDFNGKFTGVLSRSVDCVFCDADWLDEATRKLVIPWRYNQEALQRDPISYLVTHPVGTNNGVFRRESFLRAGGFDESLLMWEDCDVYVRIAAQGGRMLHLPEILTWSLRHRDSFSHEYGKSWGYRLKALERYAATLPPHCMPAVAEAAEDAATNLDLYKRGALAQQAIALCQRLGHRVPSTSNPILQAVRPLLPALWGLRIQRVFRSRQRSTH